MLCIHREKIISICLLNSPLDLSLQVFLDLFRKEASAADIGSFFANANVIANSNAKGDIENSYNEIKEFV